jgi:AraC-like DNA-binding protein
MAKLSGQEGPRLLSSAILLGSREAALELGIDLNATLREYRINPRLLTSPEGYLTHYQVINFLQTVAERFNCEHFGFLVGKHQVPMQFGLLAQLMKLSPTLRVSLENGMHYSELYTQITRHAVVTEGGYASFRRWDAQPYQGSAVQLHTLGVVQISKILQTLCGSAWQATSISFAHSAPKEKQQISRYFSCPVHFDGEFDGVLFPESDLSKPIATANTDLLKVVQAHLDTQQSSHGQDDEIVSRVGGFIRREIGSNLCNLDSCAQLFNVHPRSLQRELAKHGCTFKQLLLDMRMELAEQYLRGSNISLSDLTGMLGYNNLSAFSRAFKNKNGQSPELWRKQLLLN